MTDAYFIRGYNLDVVTWIEAFLNYNNSVNHNKLISCEHPGFFISHDAHEIEKVKQVLKNLNCNAAHLYFNIATKAKTFGNHKDSMDVYFWQCQGVTKWIIDNKDEVILNPGDLIYVPKGVYHKVIPLSPRLGVSMSIVNI